MAISEACKRFVTEAVEARRRQVKEELAPRTAAVEALKKELAAFA